MDYSKNENRKKSKPGRKRLKQTVNSISVLVLRVAVIGIIIAAFVVIGGGLGMYLGVLSNVPEFEVFQTVPEAYTSIIYEASTGKEIDRLHSEENREYVKLDNIPVNVQNAVQAIEDQRFFEHSGIDPKGMVRALYVNLQSQSFDEGASTITQQLIKLNVLKDSSKKLERKLQEQFIALQYEKRLVEVLGSKQAAKNYILELYLNTINLGHGAYGVQAASMLYFNKEVSELTLSEAATIAAITKNPWGLSPIKFPEKNSDRREAVLDKMVELGYITDSEFDEAMADDVYARVKLNDEIQKQDETVHSFFVDEVITSIVNDLVAKGYSTQQANSLIYSGGLKIYTTIDTQIQAVVDETYRDDSLFPPRAVEYMVKYSYKLEDPVTGETTQYNRDFTVPTEDEIPAFIENIKAEVTSDGHKVTEEYYKSTIQVQSAMVIMDYRTGEVKAIAGGRGEKTENRLFNRATMAQRSPGSVFKVLAVYAPGIDTGKLTAATTIPDEEYIVKEFDNYKPSNWWGATYRGLSTVRTAVKDSMNVVTVRALMEYTGLDTAFDYLKNFGFDHLVEREEKNGRVNSDKVPSVALGGITYGVTPLELAGAYGSIANDGMYNKPIFYTKVLNHDNTVLLENTPEPRQVLKTSSAFILTDIMKDVVTQGTGRLAQFKEVKMPIAGKTGTTSKDVDLVFAGYTPYYVASIWMGYDYQKKIDYRPLDSNENKSYHLLLWSAIMERIHSDLPYKDFERPDGIVTKSICSLTGKIASPGLCDADSESKTVTDYFILGTEPSDVCDGHETVTICSESNKLVNEFCPDELRNQIVRKKSGNTNDHFGINVDTPVGDVLSDLYCDIHKAPEEEPIGPVDENGVPIEEEPLVPPDDSNETNIPTIHEMPNVTEPETPVRRPNNGIIRPIDRGDTEDDDLIIID